MRDDKLTELLQEEERRQAETINLIASENYAPLSVRQIGSSVLTNKYTEGYPGKRYYAGCSVFDHIEELAQKRACQLFGASWANVQPHSGASANNAVFQALLDPGDRLLSLALAEGGHLSHGMKLNVSGTFYRPSFYHLRGTAIDMDEVRDLAIAQKPNLIIAGWSAYTDTIDFPAFRSIADEVGALLLVDMSHFSGLVAGGEYPSPFPWADIVTSTTHKTLRGPRGGIILGSSQSWKAEIDRAVFPGQQGGALPQTIAAKAHCFYLASTPSWTTYARRMIENARALASGIGQGVICAGRTHQVLLDLQGRSGRQAEQLLERQAIICNRNTIPGEKRSPADPSGLRFGTAAMTTRGMGPEEFRLLGEMISSALQGVEIDIKPLLAKLPPSTNNLSSTVYIPGLD